MTLESREGRPTNNWSFKQLQREANLAVPLLCIRLVEDSAGRSCSPTDALPFWPARL